MSAGQLSLGVRRPAGEVAARRLIVWGCVTLAVLFLFVLSAGGGAAFGLGLVLGGLICYAAWRWPTQTAVVLVVLLPLSRFQSVVLFSLYESDLILRFSQLWKDAVIIVLVARVTHDAFLRRTAPRVYYLDLLVASFLVLTLFYVLYPGLDSGSKITTRLLGFRQDALPLLAYFVGRGLHLQSRDQVQWIMLAFVPIGMAIAIVSVWQWIAPEQSTAVFDALGYSKFAQSVLGGDFPLIETRELINAEVPRAGSLLLGGLALSFYQLLAVPVAAAFFFFARGRGQWAAGVFLLAMLVTLGLTFTRISMVASVFSVILIGLYSGSHVKLGWVLSGITALALAFVIVSGFNGDAFAELTSPNEGSVRAHREAFDASLVRIQEAPLGHGLGTAGLVSQQAEVLTGSSVEVFGTENWYLQLAVEMGVLSMLLFALALLAAIFMSLRASAQVSDIWLKVLTVAVTGAGISLAITGAFLQVWEVTIVAFLFWLMAGIAVRAPEIEKQWAESPDGDEGS